MQRETGCLIADMSHCRIIEPEELQGLNGSRLGTSHQTR